MSLAGFAAGQALTPAEVKNPQMRALQDKYLHQLQAVGAEVQAHVFPYPFYFSRVLDLDLAQQGRADQRSLRFDNYNGMTVVELTRGGRWWDETPRRTAMRPRRVKRLDTVHGLVGWGAGLAQW